MASHDTRLSAMGEVVRRNDRDRFVATLFADPAHREALFALTAFHVELANIRAAVTEPHLGLIRLQWWRDRLEEMGRGQAPPVGQPVLEALFAIISEQKLPTAPFLEMIDAHDQEYAEDILLGLSDFEGYVAATSGNLAGLHARVQGADDGVQAAAARLGAVYGGVGLMRALAAHASHGRHYLPKQLLEEMGAGSRIPLSPHKTEVRPLVQALHGKLTEELQQVKDNLDDLWTQAPGVAPLYPVSRNILKVLKKTGFNPADRRVMTVRPPALKILLSRLFR